MMKLEEMRLTALDRAMQRAEASGGASADTVLTDAKKFYDWIKDGKLPSS